MKIVNYCNEIQYNLEKEILKKHHRLSRGPWEDLILLSIDNIIYMRVAEIYDNLEDIHFREMSQIFDEGSTHILLY